MIDYYFVKLLYDLAREQASPNVIIALRDKSLATIIDGDGTQLISATIEGKTVNKKVYKDPAQLAQECSLALDYYNNGPQGSFGIDYTGLGV
jgi:hypothetical protein